jgi:hypothetical protein
MTSLRLTVFGVVIAVVLLVLVLELVRSRRLQERYAILWLLTGLVLLVLSIWSGAIQALSDLVGIAYPPALLFAVSLVFVVIVLLHYSTVISRLAQQNVALAQSIALLEERLRRIECSGDAPPDSGE